MPTRYRFTILSVGRDAHIAPRIPDAETMVPARADVGIGPYAGGVASLSPSPPEGGEGNADTLFIPERRCTKSRRWPAFRKRPYSHPRRNSCQCPQQGCWTGQS